MEIDPFIFKQVVEQASTEELAELQKLLVKMPVQIWNALPGPQTAGYNCEADQLYFGGSGGSSKALAIDTPIPTPNGWMQMRDICIGQQIFGKKGNIVNVVAVSPVMEGHICYRVIFSDGAQIIADAGHEWLTRNAKERLQSLHLTPEWREWRRNKRPSRATGKNLRPHVASCNSERKYEYLDVPIGTIVTTETIANSLSLRTNRNDHNYSISVCSPLILPEKTLLIDPYLLGLWLGDGSSYKAEISTADDEILLSIESLGYEVKKRGKYEYGINGGLLVLLRSLGVLKNKHIPKEYMRGSIGQRIALLQGLMDTDGCCGKKSGECSFSTTKQQLKDSVLELLATLGIKSVASESRAKLYGKDCGPVWNIKFFSNIPAFRLNRKLERQKRDGFRGTHSERYITACDPVKSVPVKCIAVDSIDHLYLAGRNMIPTHNTDLLLGLSLTSHTRSIIFRKQATELPSIIDRLTEIVGSRDGFNGTDKIWRVPANIVHRDCQIEFGSTPFPGDHEKYRGRPHDLIAFDEIPAFTEYEVRFLCGWLRTTKKGQRCRVVMAGNPPEDPSNLEKGGWLIKYYGPWLDPDHPNPAKSGELRYFVMIDGKEVERPHGKPFEWRGKILTPKSRTFIPGTVEDNPFLMETGYDQTLEALPEPLRSQMRYGNFSIGKNEDPWQVLPTSWVKAAQDRWTAEGKRGKRMLSMGVDVSRGGKDRTSMCGRFGKNWYDVPIEYPGSFVQDGNAAAGLVFLNLKDGAPVHIDIVNCGTSAYDHLKNNEIYVIPINGAAGGNGTDRSGVLRFYNKRAEIYWKFREALDPAYRSEVCLPPGNQIRAELCAAKWGLTKKFDGKGILIEAKEDIKNRIGVSPDLAESILYASVDSPPRQQSPPDDELQRILRGRNDSGPSSMCA